MHDGGVSIGMKVNGKLQCTSNAIYDGPRWTAKDGKVWTSISKMSDCENPIPVKKGDSIFFDVKFDEVAHPP
jgi:hypothetical protein